MSYERVIGFGLDPSRPKGYVVSPSGRELAYLERLGVQPIFCDLKTRLPDQNREPEQKLLLPTARGFSQIRNTLITASNTFIIPGQAYTEKNPLTSILLDSTDGSLDQNHYTLRYRFEMDPRTGFMTQGDFNEKSGMKNSTVIGGCIDRFERELEQRPGESHEDAYNAFLRKYRRRNDPAFSDGIAYQDLRVGGAYQAARNEIGIAFKHPQANVLMVFEACEDFWIGTEQNVSDPIAKFYEWEIELKQVWGELPRDAQRPEALRHFLYSAMTDFRDAIHRLTPDSSINLKSKAEITKEHLDEYYGVNEDTLESLHAVFGQRAVKGDSAGFQMSVAHGRTLSQTLQEEHKGITRNAAKLDFEKREFNSGAPAQTRDLIGYGNQRLALAA